MYALLGKHKAQSTQKQLNERHEPAHARMLPGPDQVCMRHVRSAARISQEHKSGPRAARAYCKGGGLDKGGGWLMAGGGELRAGIRSAVQTSARGHAVLGGCRSLVCGHASAMLAGTRHLIAWTTGSTQGKCCLRQGIFVNQAHLRGSATGGTVSRGGGGLRTGIVVQ